MKKLFIFLVLINVLNIIVAQKEYIEFGEFDSLYIDELIEDTKGNLWCSAYYKSIGSGTTYYYYYLGKYDGEKWEFFKEENNIFGNNYMYFESTAGQSMSGASMLKAGALLMENIAEGKKHDSSFVFKEKEGISGGEFDVIFEDSKNSLWIGSSKGISKYEGNKWKTYCTFNDKGRKGLSRTSSITEDSKERIWICINMRNNFNEPFQGVLLMHNDNKLSRMDTLNGFIMGAAHKIIEDYNGNIWYGSSSGIYKYYDNKWIEYTENLKDYTCVLNIEKDNKGNIWIFAKEPGSATINTAIIQYDGENWKIFDDKYGIKGIIKMHKDNNDNIWFIYPASISDIGIYKFDGANMIEYNEKDGLNTTGLNPIFYEDSYGNIWLCKYKISKFDGTNWKTYTSNDGLTGTRITRIIEDNENNIWVSSTTGLSKFDGEKWETYKTTDGLLKNNVTVKCIDQEGNLWLKYNVNWSIFNKTIAIAKFDKMNFENIKYYSKRITHLNFINEDKNGNIWVGLNHKLMVYPKTDVVR